MPAVAAKRILFSGYAPVHFLCFLPIYERLAQDERIELWLSGGFRRVVDKKKDVATYALEGFYDPFPVDHSRVISLEQARAEDFDVVVCAHTSDTLFPRSVKRSVQIYHGVSFKNLAVRDKALKFDLLCLPGRYHAERYQQQGLVRPNGARCLLTGFPKSDALVATPFDRAKVLAELNLDPLLPTLLLAPTGEKDNALEIMGEAIVEEVRKAGRWNLLVKPHDHPKNPIDWFKRLAPLVGDRVRLVRDRDVVPYLKAADALITDASSVAVEFTLLDRPIVFIDSPKLLTRVRKRSPAMDLETYGRKIGTVVKRARDLVPTVAESLAHPERQSELRRAMARHVFYQPGTAVERVTGVVLYAAGLREDLPSDVEILRPAVAARA